MREGKEGQEGGQGGRKGVGKGEEGGEGGRGEGEGHNACLPNWNSLGCTGGHRILPITLNLKFFQWTAQYMYMYM